MKTLKEKYKLKDLNWTWEQLPTHYWFSKEIYKKFGIEVLSLYVGERLELNKNLFIGD